MSVLNTVLIFVAIPVAVILGIAALTRVGSDSGRPSRRYRPGRPYDFAPTWFLSAPERSAPDRPQLEAGILTDVTGRPVRPGSTGGASDRW